MTPIPTSVCVYIRTRTIGNFVDGVLLVERIHATCGFGKDRKARLAHKSASRPLTTHTATRHPRTNRGKKALRSVSCPRPTARRGQAVAVGVAVTVAVDKGGRRPRRPCRPILPSPRALARRPRPPVASPSSWSPPSRRRPAWGVPPPGRSGSPSSGPGPRAI